MTLTKEALAARLHGIELDALFHEAIKAAAEEAKGAGLLIVCGASDDLAEFYGHFREEADCYDGDTIHLDRSGVLSRDQCETDDEIADFTIRRRTSRTIEAIWGRDGISWQYETEIPHATFDVMVDGEVYCRALIIEARDLPEPAKS